MEALESTSCSIDWGEDAGEENDMVGSASISYEFTSTVSQNMQYIPGAVVSTPGDFVEGTRSDCDEDGKIFCVYVL